MGADGSIVIARREDFERENPGVAPDDLGLYTGTVLGIEACWGYYGDNLYEPNYGHDHCFESRWDPEAGTFVPLTYEETMARKAALEWFDANAEHHEVWT